MLLFTHGACLKHDVAPPMPEVPARLTEVLAALGFWPLEACIDHLSTDLSPSVIPAKAGIQSAFPLETESPFLNRRPNLSRPLDSGLRRNDAGGGEAGIHSAATESFQNLSLVLASSIPREVLLLAHEAAYLDQVARLMPKRGLWALDDETIVSPGSLEAGLYAAGAVWAAAKAVREGPDPLAFCAVRPPGHHAGRAHSGGFCFFNNVAIAALAARAEGATRVALVDFDAHHGDGTQEIVAADPGIFFASLHQGTLAGPTGQADVRGTHGNILNIPLPEGTTGTAYRQIFESALLPRLEAFQADLVLVSAGFDAHRDDPLSALCLETADYAWIGEDLARERRGRPLVAALEGGYALPALGASVAAFVSGLQKGFSS